MSFKEELLIFFKKENRSYTLSEIITGFPNHTPSSVRGTLNLLVKKGVLYRPNKATYAEASL